MQSGNEDILQRWRNRSQAVHAHPGIRQSTREAFEDPLCRLSRPGQGAYCAQAQVQQFTKLGDVLHVRIGLEDPLRQVSGLGPQFQDVAGQGREDLAW